MNKVMILGNVGSSELRTSTGGSSFLKFSVATNEKWTSKDGEKQERTEWFNCTLFGPRAEKLSQYVEKGTRLFVEGRLQTDKVGDGDDAKYYTSVIVNNIEFAGGSKKNATTEEEDPFGQ